MASPHVAGAVGAPQADPSDMDGRADQVRARPDRDAGLTSSNHTTETTSAREGGGFIKLPRRERPAHLRLPHRPLVRPHARRATSATRSISFTDAGGGAGHGSPVDLRQGPGGSITAPASVAVPGTLQVTANATGRQQGDVTGFIVLTKGAASRRLPFWFHIEAPQLPRQPHGKLQEDRHVQGQHQTATRARRQRYRYPDNPTGVDIPANLPGPEQVFTVRLTKPVANFGVAILNQGAGVSRSSRGSSRTTTRTS